MASGKVRHFENPFDDYSPTAAANMILQGGPHPESKVALSVQSKWEQTCNRLQNAVFHDYSVYVGAAGIALLYLRKNPDSKSNLENILSMLPLDNLKNRKQTFLCGDAGPLAICAVVYYKLRRKIETQCISRLQQMQDDILNHTSGFPNEYLYGRAGFLFALLYVNKHIDPAPFSDSTIRRIIDAILLSGKDLAKKGKFECPLMWQWHESFYLGAAHGVSGIIYLLLQAKQYLTDSELNSLIKPTIDYMATLRYLSGNYPSSLGSLNDKYVQWCHGAPSFVYMFSIAYKVFGDDKYLKLALESGEVVWKRGLVRKGYSICHGVAGNAYCFLQLYQTTKDEKHLYRAMKFTEWCIDYKKEHEEYSPDRPFSLYEGIAGPMYLLLDIQKPLEAKMPGFTL